jgi:hypothetical protein
MPKNSFGTKEGSLLEPFERKKVTFKDSFRDKEGKALSENIYGAHY